MAGETHGCRQGSSGNISTTPIHCNMLQCKVWLGTSQGAGQEFETAPGSLDESNVVVCLVACLGEAAKPGFMLAAL